MELEPRRIDDENVGEHAALVRGLVVQRLEQIWTTCEPHVNGHVEAQGLRPDPRFIEAGIRVLDRLSKLYRLDSPQRTDPESNTGINDPAGLVESQLRELEARVVGREP